MSHKNQTPSDNIEPETSNSLLGEQENVRLQKMAKLAEAGKDLFPHKVKITHTVSEVISTYMELPEEELKNQDIRIVVPGRIMSIRKMGRAVFFHISDSRKQLQGYLREDKVGKEEFQLFSLLDIGDRVALSGQLFKTRTGELTVMLNAYTFLAKCLHPLPEKWHGLQDKELRFRKRYLDFIVNPEEVELFRFRSAAIRHIRRFFDDRGYIEVETPMMHAVPGGALAKPFKTFHNALGIDLYLRIAPELYLKRLTVGGFDKVYEINRNFRNEGISAEHNPEFTMLEFYEAYADYYDMMEMTETLITELSRDLLGKEEIVYGEHTISLARPWKKLKYMEALTNFSGLAPGRFDDKAGIIELASSLSGDEDSLTYYKALDVLFDKYVEPNLIQPTFIVNPPKAISPLAKASPENPEEAERFELFMGGMEISNAFSELTDPAEQKKRFEAQAEARKQGDEESHVVDMDYINALEYGIPPTGGQGIGIDRLVMLLANRRSIREVILFPLLRPR